MSSVKVSQFNNYTSYSTRADTLMKTVFPVKKNLRICSMNFSVCGEVVFKSVSAIEAKIFSLLNYKLTASKSPGREAWVEYTCVVEFQLSIR